jgi:Rps23 Pro-64 3,4-dihydroxylase Tpa1-like proline 4-hydroxylase
VVEWGLAMRSQSYNFIVVAYTQSSWQQGEAEQDIIASRIKQTFGGTVYERDHRFIHDIDPEAEKRNREFFKQVEHAQLQRKLRQQAEYREVVKRYLKQNPQAKAKPPSKRKPKNKIEPKSMFEVLQGKAWREYLENKKREEAEKEAKRQKEIEDAKILWKDDFSILGYSLVDWCKD